MARHIPDEIIDQIRMRADIVEVVQSYVPTLKKAGATWKACCPFHQEKTPSFVVNPQRQTYKCFGCGKGGNAISFIMDFEKLDFPNAVELLARKYGIIIPDPEPVHYHSGKNAEENRTVHESSYSTRERLYQLHEKLASFYEKNLHEHPDSPVAQYFKTRGIPPEFAMRFHIGSAPDSWDAAIRFAHSEHFTDEELRLSGIVSEKEPGSAHIYDRFRNRLMFPIWNEQGRIVAFSARSIEADPKGWKYVNSPESPVFKKSRTLYALHLARSAIAEKDSAVLCEGQLDTIALHRAGCTNAVAPQGTAFGQEQALILKRYTQNITLALDNDKAGRAAVFKDAAILLPLGFSLKVAVYTSAKDADEMLKNQGPEAVRKAVEDDSTDFFDFSFTLACTKYDASTPAGKAAITAGLLSQIAWVDSESMREAYLSWLSSKTQIHSDALRADLHKILAKTEKVSRNHPGDGHSFQQATLSSPSGISPKSAAPEMPPRSVRMPGLRKCFAEFLQTLLSEERFAEMASRDVDKEMLDLSPCGIAIETVIECEFNGEWEDAPQKILLRLQRENLPLEEVSGLLTSVDVIDEDAHAGTGLSTGNTDATGSVSSGNLSDPENAGILARKRNAFLEATYHACVKHIRKSFYTDERQKLIRQALTLPDGPEKMELTRKITAYSRSLLDLSRTPRAQTHS